MKDLVEYDLRTDHRKKSFQRNYKKEKQLHDSIDFFNLNTHGLKEQSTRTIFIILQPTAKAYSPLW